MKAAYYPLLVGLVGLLLSFVLVREQPLAPAVNEQNMKLALRQVAHELLIEGDQRHMAIPPVEMLHEREYRLPLGIDIDYDCLLKTAPEIMVRHGIMQDYQLSLLDCQSMEFLLGFDASSLDRPDGPSCLERDQASGCHTLALTITTPPGGPRPMLYIMGGLALLSILIGRNETEAPSAAVAATDTPKGIAFGQQSHFSFQDQRLTIGTSVSELTYREAKLLDYFVSHPNEVLDRERIHAAVWGSEGIIVGRSLDVFISRLRKKLAADDSVEILTVHGVGYRLRC